METNKKWLNILLAVVVFIAIITIGNLYIDNSRLASMESALLFLAATIGAGFYWLSANRTK